MRCEVRFPIGATEGIYFSFCSGIKTLFIRNYIERQTVKEIRLDSIPTCLHMDKYDQLDLACVGTQDGRLFVYSISEDFQDELQLQTRGGLIYGEVEGISTKADGDHITVASSSGELLNFNYKSALQINQD